MICSGWSMYHINYVCCNQSLMSEGIFWVSGSVRQPCHGQSPFHCPATDIWLFLGGGHGQGGRVRTNQGYGCPQGQEWFKHWIWGTFWFLAEGLHASFLKLLSHGKKCYLFSCLHGIVATWAMYPREDVRWLDQKCLALHSYWCIHWQVRVEGRFCPVPVTLTCAEGSSTPGAMSHVLPCYIKPLGINLGLKKMHP